MGQPNLLTTAQMAEELELSQIRVCQLCQEQRIQGAYKLGRAWVAPAPIVVLPPRRPHGRPRKHVVVEGPASKSATPLFSGSSEECAAWRDRQPLERRARLTIFAPSLIGRRDRPED